MNLKISKVTISISIVLLLTALTFVMVEPVKALEADVTILSNSSYLTSSGSYYYIVGEVQNTGETAVEFVKITATCYDSSNNVLLTDYTYTQLGVLPLNAKSPFTVIISSEDGDIDEIDTYTLSVTYSSTTTPEQELSIVSHNSHVSNTGAMHVTGEIKNNGDSKSVNTILYATYYDSSGKVVGSDFGYPEPEDIEAGATASFDVLNIDYDRVPMYASYSLTAESNQYSLLSGDGTTTTPTASAEPTSTPTVPEYSLVAVLIALLIATFCSMLLLKGKLGQKQ